MAVLETLRTFGCGCSTVDGILVCLSSTVHTCRFEQSLLPPVVTQCAARGRNSPMKL